MPKRFGLSTFVFAFVTLTISFTGCRTATNSLSSVPGLGWLNRGTDEGWAQYEPAPGLPRPSETNEPTAGPGVSGIASSEQLRGSTTRSFDEVSKLASKDRFDRSRYMPKTSSDTNSSYTSAYGKYGPPKALDDSSVADASTSTPQSGLYDVETPKYEPKTTASDNRFAKNGYDLGYDSVASKPYVKPSASKPAAEAPAAEEKSSPAPFGYVANNRFESSSKPAASPGFDAKAKPYTPPGFAKTTSTAGKQFEAAKSDFSSGIASTTNTVSSAADKAIQQGSRFANDVSQSVQATTSETFNRFGNDVKAQANAVANSAQQTFQPYAGAAKANTQAAPSRFGEFVNSTQNQVANAAQSATNKLSGAASNTYNNATAEASKFAQGIQQSASNTVASATNTFQAEAAKASDYAADRFNKFAANAKSSVQNTVGNVQQQATGQFQTYAQQAQQSVSNTVGQATQNVEQSVASQYQQAKTAASDYANSSLNSAKAQASQFANNVANSVKSSDAYQTASTAVNNAQQQFSGAMTSVNNALQNVSAPMQGSPVQGATMQGTATQGTYPTTSTPNPYVVPGSAIKGASNRYPATGPSANTMPAAPPSTYSVPPANNSGPAFRTATPFLPGSTKSFQGAQTTRKPTVQLASATTPDSTNATDEHLVLAVGDVYQFPRNLR